VIDPIVTLYLPSSKPQDTTEPPAAALQFENFMFVKVNVNVNVNAIVIAHVIS
jgi:hypothetical protein